MAACRDECGQAALLRYSFACTDTGKRVIASA